MWTSLYISQHLISFKADLILLFRSLEQLLNQKRPQYIKAKENTSHHLKKLDMAKKSVKDSEKQCSKQEEDIKALETELVDLDVAWKSFEKQAEEVLQKVRDIELEASQVKTQRVENLSLLVFHLLWIRKSLTNDLSDP